MHIFFSGIGGTAIGPLALIAKQAGHTVSGSDKQDSQYIRYLRSHGVDDIHIGQSYEQLAAVHRDKPIDWYVYSSAVSIEDADAPELRFCRDHALKTSKRAELLNRIIADKNLKLIAVAGTHGKTTTTAMAIWLFKQLGIAVSYSVGAKIGFGEMGEYEEGSEYFVYEADEFDRNFLAFHPYISLITGVDWDHHEIFPTREDYKQAFLEFLAHSKHVAIWEKDREYLGYKPADSDLELGKQPFSTTLVGEVNRADARLVMEAMRTFGMTDKPLIALSEIMNRFPGLNRRFERLVDGLYTDYAHTPTKIRGSLQTAQETSKNIVVIYEPLTNRRQHFIKDEYKNLFQGVKKLYWVPSYEAREDPNQPVLSPAELIGHMDNAEIAEPAALDEQLKRHIQEHLKAGDLVLAMSGGGGSSLDEWLRKQFG